MNDRWIPLLAIASFAAFGWVAGYSYAMVSTDVGTLLGVGVGVAYAAWYWQSDY